MKAIVFDVDDTLYDLSTPFKQTCREIFPEDTELDLEGAFLASRRYSDSVYARCLSGEMSMEEMYIYRFKNAFLDYGKKINALKALQESVRRGNQRFLFEMATGTGKTLTSAAVIRLFLRSGNE